jgi:circadian clock protein KaiC
MQKASKAGIRKCRTGIDGFDEITDGGLPYGRTSLLCGSAGAGKTVFGMEFLIHGIVECDEPGVFVSFEETETDLVENVTSFGYDLEALQTQGKLAIDHVFIERSEIEETGEYDLEGLFIRLASAVESVNAKRVVLDSIEVLFSGLQNHGVIRSELRRLFRWLKDPNLTAIVTGERGDGGLTRHGLEE